MQTADLVPLRRRLVEALRRKVCGGGEEVGERLGRLLEHLLVEQL